MTFLKTLKIIGKSSKILLLHLNNPFSVILINKPTNLKRVEVKKSKQEKKKKKKCFAVISSNPFLSL